MLSLHSLPAEPGLLVDDKVLPCSPLLLPGSSLHVTQRGCYLCLSWSLSIHRQIYCLHSGLLGILVLCGAGSCAQNSWKPRNAQTRRPEHLELPGYCFREAACHAAQGCGEPCSEPHYKALRLGGQTQTTFRCTGVPTAAVEQNTGDPIQPKYFEQGPDKRRRAGPGMAACGPKRTHI